MPLIRRLRRALAGGAGLLLAWAGAAAASTCTAAMSDITFGSISVRSGVTNATSGTLQIQCTGAVAGAVGACIRFGPGSGGAGASNSPRYMRRADNARLNYELRPTGNGAVHGTWNEVFVLIPVVLGSGSAAVTVFADITSVGVGTGTGFYSSTFTGASNAHVQYDVPNCAASGPTATVSAFTVSADVQSSCEVDAAALNFGTIPHGITAPIDADAALTVRCTASTDYAIRLGLGTGPGVSSPERRRMSFGPASIEYGLYQNSARTMVWGDTAATDVEGQGAGTDQTFLIHGRIHGGQNALAGIYSDAVVVIVEYD